VGAPRREHLLPPGCDRALIDPLVEVHSPLDEAEA